MSGLNRLLQGKPLYRAITIALLCVAFYWIGSRLHWGGTFHWDAVLDHLSGKTRMEEQRRQQVLDQLEQKRRDIQKDLRRADYDQKLADEVATDAVTRYGIAKRNGSSTAVCVQAGLVAAAYLQAKNEKEYRKWTEIEKADCERAGIDR
jgi:hypothetical protein